MALSIKNERVETLARELAALKGESLTDTILFALQERWGRHAGRRALPDLVEDILAISGRCAALPDHDTRSPDEILGYSEVGAP